MRDAKRVEVWVKGKASGKTPAGRDKIRRFYQSYDVLSAAQERRLPMGLANRIQDLLARRGYRTGYKLDEVEWRGKQTSRSASAKLKQLRAVEIVVVVHKGRKPGRGKK